MLYLVSRVAPNVADLTIDQAMDKLVGETKDLIDNIFDNFPQVKIVRAALISCAVVAEIPDEATAERLGKTCNCNIKKLP